LAPEHVVVGLGGLGVLGLGAFGIKEDVTDDNVARPLDGVGQDGVVVAGAFDGADALQYGWRRVPADSSALRASTAEFFSG